MTHTIVRPITTFTDFERCFAIIAAAVHVKRACIRKPIAPLVSVVDIAGLRFVMSEEDSQSDAIA